MARQDTSRRDEKIVRAALGACGDKNYLVICQLDDSWSSLADEVALLDRWFGAEIVNLFGDKS